ncbi:MAG: DUF4256 domain-containing protein [Bacteroidetes bacterium]|jgi:hypothetical protein|nr:DUF4256 domain-containing protein [Bacteroidota bacterium]
MKKKLTSKQVEELINTLKSRFEKHMSRHKGLVWDAVEKKLKSNLEKIWSLYEMERTGGEPDVVVPIAIGNDKKTNEFIFMDCSAESPKERRSLCYDQAALNARKENKSKNSAMALAAEMGIEILSEEEYRALQKFGPFDMKTSSWLKTPSDIRKLGGAIFGDFRYGTIFLYHNGAESYYAARGFRGLLRV